MYLFQRRFDRLPSFFIFYLHSTMYLFQPATGSSDTDSVHSFTFHYVSISTIIPLILLIFLTHLHSTMYLFQPVEHRINLVRHIHLHSTMYLFQPTGTLTFSLILRNLHSTMYLFQRHNALSSLI